MSGDDQRPAWDFQEMSEADFRKILEFGLIETVTAGYTMTSVDTADEWLKAKNSRGQSMIMPPRWANVLDFVGKSSVPGLFKYNYLGEQMQKRLQEIDAWEDRNRKERADYERLKRKFETS